MDSKVIRSDYCQIGLNSPNCLKVVDERDDDETIQFVVGDYSGSVQSLKLKSGKLYENVFKSPPKPDSRINSIQVVSHETNKKIFFTSGPQAIRGVNMKAKQFFNLELNDLPEPIKLMKLIWPTDIFVCGDFIYNHYIISTKTSTKQPNEVTLVDSFICPGKVADMEILDDKMLTRTMTILASEDRLIRLLQGSSCLYELETNGMPTCLVLLPKLGDTSHLSFCYGSSDGKTTMVKVKQTQGPSFIWEIPESGSSSTSSQSKASVSALTVSMTGKELVVGRSDGAIEVWVFPGVLDLDETEKLDLDSIPSLRFTFSCNESVTSLCLSRDAQLIIVSTFTGSIFGLEWKGTTKKKVTREAVDDLIHRIEILRSECQDLEMTLTVERAKYLQSTEVTSANPKDIGLSALPVFVVKDSMILNDDASYSLNVEAEVPIDVIILQSDVPIDVVDSEKNSAVTSFSESESEEVLVTFRCQSNTTRIEMTIRTIEGQYGQMRIYVISRMTPKSCQVRLHQICPLSLHRRSYNQLPASVEDICRLEISGDFSFEESHQWIYISLPEIPEKVVQSKDLLEYHFKSTLCGSVLSCAVSEGSLIFEADNVSTISILKDFITRKATSEGMRIDVATRVGDSSLSATLRKFYPIVRDIIEAKTYARLKSAVNDLSRGDSQIADEILEDVDAEFEGKKTIPTISLDRILGIITDLIIDEMKLKGKASKSNLTAIRNKVSDLQPSIEQLLQNGVDVEGFVAGLKDFWFKS